MNKTTMSVQELAAEMGLVYLRPMSLLRNLGFLL